MKNPYTLLPQRLLTREEIEKFREEARNSPYNLTAYIRLKLGLLPLNSKQRRIYECISKSEKKLRKIFNSSFTI